MWDEDSSLSTDVYQYFPHSYVYHDQPRTSIIVYHG